jgi:transposase
VRECIIERLKFIDEAAINTAMTRLRGRAAPGQRVVERVPRNYGQQTSVISCLGLSGVGATLTVEGAVDTLCFNEYVERVLRPTVVAGDVFVLDNLGAHKASRIEEVVESCGGKVIWLSPYSPDFSPIEQMWSKIKEALRAAKARTREELERALAEALKRVSQSDILGWFKHCGYMAEST